MSKLAASLCWALLVASIFREGTSRPFRPTGIISPPTSSVYDPSAAVDLGTTILAIPFKDGVVLAADSRTSQGIYVSNRLARKLDVLMDGNDESVNSNWLCAVGRSGSAADTQWLVQQVRHEFQVRSIKYDSILQVPGSKKSTTPGAHPVWQRIHFMKHLIRSSQHELTAALIFAAYDKESDQVIMASLLPGGSLLMDERNFVCSGSGSAFIMGYLDDQLTLPHTERSQEEATQMALNAIRLASQRDSKSGGVTRIMVLNRHGIEESSIVNRENDEIPSQASTRDKAIELKGFAPRKNPAS